MTRRVNLMFCTLIASAWMNTSCDDAVGSPPQAAVAISLNADPTSAGNCVSTGTDSLPLSNGEVLRLSSRTRKEDLKNLPRLTDGKDGASVSCKVTETAAGTSYTFSASMAGTSSKTGAGREFSIRNASVSGGVGANATVSWLSPNLDSAMQSSVCSLSVDEQVEGGGAIKVTFSCPQFMNPSRPDVICEANGTLVLELCDK